MNVAAAQPLTVYFFVTNFCCVMCIYIQTLYTHMGA